jgi:hypothetical protein
MGAGPPSLVTPDERGVAVLADRQHDVVSAGQLRALGVGSEEPRATAQTLRALLTGQFVGRTER